jgi:hypothetical protein
VQVFALSEFDRSWIQEKLEPEDYFTRLLRSGVALRNAWMREDIESNRQMVREIWCEGDELWYWRYRINGGISGIDGLVLLRGGEVVRAWCNGRIL